jgi:hypothetical protein
MPTLKTVSLAEFSRLRGVSRKTVSVWRQKGWLVTAKDGRVEVAASVARLAQRPAVYRGGRTKGGIELAEAKLDELLAETAPLSLVEAQRVKENYLAKLRRLEFETESKTLVPADQVEQCWTTLVGVVKKHALALPNAAADELAMKSAAECAAILTRRIRHMLAELAATEVVDSDNGNGAAGDA